MHIRPRSNFSDITLKCRNLAMSLTVDFQTILYTDFFGNFMISLRAKFAGPAPVTHHLSLSDPQLKKVFTRSSCYFTLYMEITDIKCTYFSKTYCHTSFQNHKISDSSALQVRVTVIFLVRTAGNLKLGCYGGLRWQSVHANFRENWSSGSKFGRWDTQTENPRYELQTIHGSSGPFTLRPFHPLVRLSCGDMAANTTLNRINRLVFVMRTQTVRYKLTPYILLRPGSKRVKINCTVTSDWFI
jgi:hypothetical protein